MGNIYQPYIQAGIDHISSLQETDGTFPLFGDVISHGESIDWTTACMGSSLVEAGEDTKSPKISKIKNALLLLQRKDGGWAYNEKVPSDPDSTLRALQFFQKIGFYDRDVFGKGFAFVISHQDTTSGGICTYTPYRLAKMGYPGGGWDRPHMCVSALAYTILPEGSEKQRLKNYLEYNIRNASISPYWWTIGNYTRWEMKGLGVGMEQPGLDSVDISLCLMGTPIVRGNTRDMILQLLSLFQGDGSVTGSQIFCIPKSTVPPGEIGVQPRIIPDNSRAFSTATAIVALKRIGEL